MLGAAALAACAPSPEAPSPAGAPHPDVFLISLDTVRRDALGVYRDAGALSDTPNLDAFARDAVVFDQASAPIPFTLSSHMTLFTGLAPDVHGVLGRSHRLATGVPTLAAQLSAAGWHTRGLVTNEWMKGDFGFDRGFDRYEKVIHGLTYAERVNEKAFEILDAGDPRPLFLFLHYLDAHSDFQREGHTLPYHAPDPFRDDLGIATDDPRFCDADGECATAFLLAADDHARAVEPEVLAAARALYARGVRYLDHQVGALLAALRARGRYDDALIVILADHGEEFREHGRFIHSQAFEECVAVPLMIKLPGGRGAGRRIADPVAHEDFMPTLLALLGLPVPSSIRGTGFAPLVDGQSQDARAILVRDKGRRRYGLRAGRHKLLRDYEADTVALYDLVADPGETYDLADASPAVRDALLERLETRLRRDREHAARLAATDAGEADVLTPEERARLEAIGYVD